jgi:hypothetical protein
MSTLKVGRVPAVGCSGTLRCALEQAQRLAEVPMYFSDDGRVKQAITLSEAVRLIREEGALDPNGLAGR